MQRENNRCLRSTNGAYAYLQAHSASELEHAQPRVPQIILPPAEAPPQGLQIGLETQNRAYGNQRNARKGDACFALAGTKTLTAHLQARGTNDCRGLVREQYFQLNARAERVDLPTVTTAEVMNTRYASGNTNTNRFSDRSVRARLRADGRVRHHSRRVNSSAIGAVGGTLSAFAAHVNQHGIQMKQIRSSNILSRIVRRNDRQNQVLCVPTATAQ